MPPKYVPPKKIEHNSLTFYKKDALGKGAASIVFLYTTSGSKEKVVMKWVAANTQKYESFLKGLKNEAAALRDLDHPNIIKLKWCDTVVETDKGAYILLEYCEKNNLKTVVPTRESIRWRTSTNLADTPYMYIKQIASALDYMHRRGYMHRDIKLQNILIDADDNVKLCDFGYVIKESVSNKRCGTPNYISPEIVKGVDYDYRVDLWSFGVCIFTLWMGRCPFETCDVKMTYNKIKDPNVTIPRILEMPENPEYHIIDELCTNLLIRDPKKRISAKKAIALIDKFDKENLVGTLGDDVPPAAPSEASASASTTQKYDFGLSSTSDGEDAGDATDVVSDLIYPFVRVWLYKNGGHGVKSLEMVEEIVIDTRWSFKIVDIKKTSKKLRDITDEEARVAKYSKGEWMGIRVTLV
uniref:Protein kinase domain-containing protein n=1 Tax=viral metagenome TaxID=1070528 RepID=A0A6C0CL42_9ZZZZ